MNVTPMTTDNPGIVPPWLTKGEGDTNPGIVPPWLVGGDGDVPRILPITSPNAMAPTEFVRESAVDSPPFKTVVPV
jgi:hypothetical protein